jgi:alanyl-tRNA synthetase
MISKKDREELKKAKTDKELKQIFKKIASKNPDEYFPTIQLKKLGYMRKQCEHCGNYFWTTLKEKKVCGDPVCSGGFHVTENNPVKVKLSYIDVWKKIVEILEPRGYKPIKRYPCVARWNPTSEFTIASISAFQPYVITGEIKPPARKLIIPQFCLRFNDIENVGLTGSHNSGFTMIGQHFFGTKEEWNQGEFFMDIHDFIHKGVGLAKEEITIHEDSWAGGGSFGCSLEFFSRGVELFNQVYMMFQQTPEGPRELKLKVLDMGLGQERVAWFSQGTSNIYEATFPYVLSKLKKITNINLELALYNKFSQYSAYLNIDEVDDMDAAWQKVGNELKMDSNELRNKILPMTALYSIAEHARSLLFAINDGKLPSNVGGGYNLRVIFRRAISFIDQFDWDINIADVCEWHAEELYELFPEVSENLEDIRKILEVEKQKYYTTKKKARKILEKIISKGQITTEILVELYDSNGINPELVKQTAKRYNINVKIPDNFYSLVIERHEQVEQIHATKKEVELDLENLPETKALYYYDYTDISNKAKVLKIVDKMVVLDQTVAYPTSGGQLHDVGTINGQRFKDVFKQGNYIVHVLEEKPKFKVGDIVSVEVDKSWRTQLSQHHTSTHIVNAAARDILGDHINQAGAKKTLKSSHLDITHYEQISKEDLEKIENRANEIVKKAIDLNLSFIPRAKAESRYGMTIYQGGAVPGKNLRIVEIPGIEIEACGGTHLNNTSEAGKIKILKSQKIQDGIVRLVFTSGEATKNIEMKEDTILNQLETILDVSREKIVGRVNELIEKWKNINKSLQTGKFNEKDLTLSSKKEFYGDILSELSTILNVKKERIPKKIKKFYSEWDEGREKLKFIQDLLSKDYVANLIQDSIDFKGFKILIKKFDNLFENDLKNLSIKVLKESDNLITIFINKTGKGINLIAMLGKNPLNDLDFNIGNFIKEVVVHFGGKGGGGAGFGQGFISTNEIKVENVLKYIKNKLFNE